MNTVQTIENSYPVNFLDNEKLIGEQAWTYFHDMMTAGFRKFHDYDQIFVQGTKDSATELFTKVTGLNPANESCDCDICRGADYSVIEFQDLFQATGFERGCQYDLTLKAYLEKSGGFPAMPYMDLGEFLDKYNVLVIFSDGSTHQPIRIRKEE